MIRPDFTKLMFHNTPTLAILLTLFIQLLVVDIEAQDYALDRAQLTPDKGIKTVMLYAGENQLAYPFINLKNTNEYVTLRFDDVDAELQDFTYKLIHCDRNWKTSDLTFNEYAQGIMDDFIVDYDYSIAPRTDYVHYKLQLPNLNVKFLVSGNYKVQVFRAETSELAFERRFIVYENKISISMNIHAASSPSTRRTHQEVDVTLLNPASNISNPFEQLHVNILQNMNWSNQITDLVPLFFREQQLIFDYNDGRNAFPGLNEFRLIDSRSLNFAPQNMERVETSGDTLRYRLTPDESRASMVYLDQEDIDGHYAIGNDERRGETHITSEYGMVYFRLKPSPLFDDVYVFGGISGREVNPAFKMELNEKTGFLECQSYVKQGFYNYLYMNVPKDGEPDLTVAEGSHDNTSNHYTVIVYQREMGGRYDKVAGIKTEAYRHE